MSSHWQRNFLRALALGLIGCFGTMSTLAQQPALTAADYARAEKFMTYNTAPLILRAGVRPNWLPDGRFWYRVTTEQGNEFILVDPARGTRGPAFDHVKLAAALATASNTKVGAYQLPFQQIDFSADGKLIVNVAGRRFSCDTQGNQCQELPNANGGQRGEGQRGGQRGGPGANVMATSPDGKRTAFIRDYNLWVRDAATGKETQLTTDGVKDFGYATNNAGWTKSDSPVLAWSPDSKKIATFQHDGRGVGEMYLASTVAGHPKLEAWKYPLPGDAKIFMIERVIIDVDTAKIIRLKMPADAHRSTLCDHIVCGGTWADVQWGSDSAQLAFASTSRDRKQVTLRLANPLTGDVRDVLEEKVDTFFESSAASSAGRVNWRYLSASNEILWYSQRDDWGQLYLYDANNGKLKNQITKGDWMVSEIVKVDEKNRQIYFWAFGLQKENPYFENLCRVGFDGKNFSMLTPESGYHLASFSPSGNFILDTYSKPDQPPVTVLRTINGKWVSEVNRADVSRLREKGWKPPTPITVKAHDGVTDIYGLLFTPTHLDSGRKYPVIDYIYPGPQGGSMGGNWSFSASRGDHQSLAELGFVVVVLEGTSNPLRSKSFHDMYYPNMSENTLPDQVGGIRQLAQRYAFLDTNRVGIWGHSGGGFATAAAMFRYPDFFKVGISESGNHDNRNYEDDWGERYIGLLTKGPDGKDNYEAQANQVYAKNLKGKLMLAHGLMDNNVPPYNTMLVVEALTRANKDYDLVVFPNAAHGFGTYSPYMMRKRWDYFVKNLLGKEPPKEYQFETRTDPRNGGQLGF